MQDRRYSDDDVNRILALAAEAEVAAVGDGGRRWSLDEIQRVGAEAGLAPASVAAAAVALERQAAAPLQTRFLGLPVALTRAVPLERPLSDDDWARLVGQLRDTFAAQGRVEVSGGRREWRNGNLRVSHEPAGEGAVLEMRTRKGNAAAMLWAAGAMLVAAVVLSSTAARALPIAFVAVALLVVGIVRLPIWAGARSRQFEAIAGFARRLASS